MQWLEGDMRDQLESVVWAIIWKEYKSDDIKPIDGGRPLQTVKNSENAFNIKKRLVN